MPAPIVVEVSAPEPKAPELAALIAACTRAASPNECITSDVKGADPPLGVAIVRREGERARIELGLRSASKAEWSTRDLVFQPGDDELERYRAIGFAIGTLVAKQMEPPPPASGSDTAEPSAPKQLAPETNAKPSEASSPKPSERETQPGDLEASAPASTPRRAPAPPRATWLEVAGSAGLGLIPGPPRLGGTLRAATELRPRGLFAVAETSYAERVDEPTLRARWLGVAVGVGHPLAPSLRSLGVDVRLMFAVERLALTANDGSRSAGDARWRPGVAVGIDGHWEVAAPVAILLGVSTFIDPEHTVVVVAGQQAGETPVLGLNGYAGLRVKLR